MNNNIYLLQTIYANNIDLLQTITAYTNLQMNLTN